MEYQPYLTFELSHTCYGLAAATVQELLLLPEIMAVPDSPSAIAGVIDLRGDIVPVLDLHRRLGRKSPPYQLSDCVIIVQTTTDRLGIIVNQVREVQPIGTDQISTQVMQSQTPGASLISGMARVGEEIVTLLNGEQLLHPLTPLSDLQSNGHQPTFQPDSPTAPPEVQAAIDLFAHLPPASRTLLQQRARDLQKPLELDNSAELLPLAVVSLQDEYFGCCLETVHEFTDISKVTPVPCCPPHIVGNMNLRGEIMTLVDIRRVVNLLASPSELQKKAIVVRLEQRVAGIVVDQIFDVVYVHPSHISPPPVAMHGSDTYLQGVVPYQNGLMSILDLPKLLASEVLVVNQEV